MLEIDDKPSASDEKILEWTAWKRSSQLGRGIALTVIRSIDTGRVTTGFVLAALNGSEGKRIVQIIGEHVQKQEHSGVEEDVTKEWNLEGQISELIENYSELTSTGRQRFLDILRKPN